MLFGFIHKICKEPNFFPVTLNFSKKSQRKWILKYPKMFLKLKQTKSTDKT